MIQIFNNILYYLNLAALLHHQLESINNASAIVATPGLPGDDNVTTTSLSPVLLQQIPPGPILPGIVVKFVCAVNNSDGSGGGSICGSTATQNEVSYQWEMYHYVEDKDGNANCTSVVKLPGQEAEMEIKFNETVSDPKTHCDLVCTINKNLPTAPPSSASIKLHFLNKDNPNVRTLPPAPPSNFKVLDATSRAAYFSWSRPRHTKTDPKANGTLIYPEITSYVIEYKNGRGNGDWQFKVSRYEINDGNTIAACVSNLSPWTTYHFRIISYSKNVSSVPSWPIIVRTAEDFPSAPPTEIKVQAIKENMLQVSWKPPPRATWNGALLGYNIGLKKASSDDDEPYVIYILHPLEPLGNLYSYRITVSDVTVQYKVVVRAFNNVGNGPFSEPVIQEREQKSEEE